MNSKTIVDQLLASGLSQKDIERRWGIPQTTISHIHRGTRGKRTSHELIQRLAAALAEFEAEQVTA